MKQVMVCVLCVAAIALASAALAQGEFRRCPNCEQVAYNNWWSYCPRCGAALAEARYTGSAAGIPADPGFQFINNTYRNLPHLFRIDKPGEVWRFVTGAELRETAPGATVQIVLPRSSVSVDVFAEKGAEDTLEAFLEKKMPVRRDFELIDEDRAGRLHDRQALRRDLTGQLGGQNVRLTLVATREGQNIYLMSALSTSDDYRRFGDEIEKIFKSFIFLAPAQ